jgi:UDP-glucose 4-epimerase
LKLVTGGAGYLGSHLARELLTCGEEVRVFDIQQTKYIPDTTEFLKGDMRDQAAVRRAMEDVDTVYHLAFVQSLSKLPERVRWDININGTENFIQASVDTGVERFVHTSTIEVYGTMPPCPCTEDAPMEHPVGWYGMHKLVTEKMLWECYREQGLKATAVRMPTICGPGYYNHRPILQLMDRVLEDKPIALVGDGGIMGDLVYYKDVLSAYLLCGEHPAAVGEAFNVSCKTPSTQLEIAEALIAEAGSQSPILRLQPAATKALLTLSSVFGLTDLPLYQLGYVLNNNVYSVEKAHELLGYAPTMSAAEAAVELIRGYAADREFVQRRSRSY